MYKLSQSSLRELRGVYSKLQEAVKYAITITKQDFRVLDGVRTKEEQLKNLARGVSKTTKSFHLYGLAVDLVPIVNGKVVFQINNKNGTINEKATLQLYVPIAEAMFEAMQKVGIHIDWGYEMWGWDMPHYQITKLDNKDARLVYDVRKGGAYA